MPKDIAAIKQAITQVCHSHEITCLHAIESGSRAWGFASPDSDYDVRLIYCHKPEWYLQLFAGKDSFEFIQDDLLAVPFDIGGWDIKKTLQLIYKSNAVIFEWLHSPIVYQQQAATISELQQLSQAYFQPLSVFHHYRGMAKTASSSLDFTGSVLLKKLFYLLRALLAANWTVQYETPPPVLMSAMLDLVNEQAQLEILELIALKSQCAEGHTQAMSRTLQQVINELWDGLENPDLSAQDKHDVTPLNEFYRHLLLQTG